MRHLLGRLYWVIFLSLALIANAEEKGKPVQKFVIETHLVRIKTNADSPKQSYGINWSGVGAPMMFPILTLPQQRVIFKMLREDKAVEFLITSSEVVNENQKVTIGINDKKSVVNQGEESDADSKKVDFLYIIPTLQADGFIRIQFKLPSEKEFTEKDDRLAYSYWFPFGEIPVNNVHASWMPPPIMDYTIKSGDGVVLIPSLFGGGRDNDYKTLLFITVSSQD